MTKEPAINIACFILFGWANNLGYHMMLSAAKDMMAGKAPTSTVLFCDVLPSFLVKLTFPFVAERIPYIWKVLMITIFGLIGFTCASFSMANIGVGLFGVVINSLSGGLGEVTFFAYSSKFSRSTVSAWSIGTGLAGISASGFYAILSDIYKVPYQTIIYMFCWIPLIMLEAYIVSSSKISPGQKISDESLDEQYLTELESFVTKQLNESSIISDEFKYHQISNNENIVLKEKYRKIDFVAKIKSLKEIGIFIFSLFMVYVSEYLINHSVNPVIDFASHSDQYYTFANFAYQIGMFITRSSMPVFRIQSYLVIVPSIIQFAFLILFSFQAIYQFITNYWIMLTLCLFEGFWGGLTYVSALYWISKKSSHHNREFRMGIASLFDTSGVLLASIIGLWYEPWLKKQHNQKM
ncbi:CLN3_protein [Hexamita inflata]|uniref:CLN3 protein n=1 Tax=Hexamita inflata TaxID=28002 RepID=A0AA86NVY2_9EUKA|nr:CLN3 protein [Hexamita inflata]